MCDFCKIINKEIDAHVVHETKRNIVFLDYCPTNKGHVLICPKIHASTILDIPDDTLMEINSIIKKLVKFYQDQYGAKSYTIMQNGGECCEYGHYHMHCFPRYEGDGFGWVDSGKEHDHSEGVAKSLREAFI
ncbi:MAG: HIT family protein [Saccharofermentans sp.]|nr:HIT family protein [Saccharofermentans sp.]